jgi:hypothetical protein
LVPVASRTPATATATATGLTDTRLTASGLTATD